MTKLLFCDIICKMQTQNVHENHRKRLYQTITSAGFDNVNDYIALEFILTYVIPRKDTNPTAHKLLDKFGTIDAVLDANIEDLIKVDGLGLQGARMLTMLPKVLKRYEVAKKKNQKEFKTNDDLINFARNYMKGKNVEELFAAFFDQNNKYIATKLVSEGGVTNVRAEKREILHIILSQKNATGVAFMHCHMNSNCAPSANDKAATRELQGLLESVGMKFVDNLIVARGRVYSFTQAKIFEEGEHL